MIQRRRLRGLEGLERRDLLAGDLPVVDGSVGQLTSLSQHVRLPSLIGPALLNSAPESVNPETTNLILLPIEMPDTGEITAQVVDGVLVIRGDTKGNHISIWGWGQNKVFLAAQSINGQPAQGSWIDPPGGLLMDGVTGGIDIDLGDGDDTVYLQESFANLDIRTGAGNDRITLGGEFEFPFKNFTTASIKWPRSALVTGDLTIDTGEGNDELSAYGYVQGDVNVQMGAGDDNFVLPSWQVLDHVTFAELKASGSRVIDLGADEVPPVNDVPADWHSDPTLADKLDPELVEAFTTIEDTRAAGSTLKGRDIVWFPPDGGRAFRTNRDGRLEVEFRFHFEDDTYNYKSLQLIEQLRARGLRMDRFSLTLGLGYAVIHESELAQLANLPGITLIQLRGVTDISDSLPGRGWSYVRPANVSILDPLAPTSPPIGPQPPSNSPPGEQGLTSLLDSYYGRGRVMGPMVL